MAKKFVRGITDIKTINNQDFDTNNVNDLLSDGTHNYIHRRKGDRSEEYHCLTDNVKTINSTDTSLLTATKDNDTNTVTLTPKHDGTKQDKLTAGYGIKIANNIITGNAPTSVSSGYNLNNFTEGVIKGYNMVNAPSQNKWYYVKAMSEGQYTTQNASELVTSGKDIKTFTRYKQGSTWTEWVSTAPTTTANEVILTSPNGTTYRLAVSDTGQVSATPVSATASTIPLDD